jgi:hypothetical protein
MFLKMYQRVLKTQKSKKVKQIIQSYKKYKYRQKSYIFLSFNEKKYRYQQ